MGLSPEAQAILDARKTKQAAQVSGTAPAPTPSTPAPTRESVDQAALLASFADMVPNLDADLKADAAPTVEQDSESMLDDAIKRMSFGEAYQKFCGKGAIKWSQADDNNMVRCPRTDHEDKNPSVAFKITTKVWECYACQDGGGVIDLVGATMGILSVQDRKNKNYHDIRRHIAKCLGWSVTKRSNGTLAVHPPGSPTRAAGTGGAFTKLLRKDSSSGAASPAPVPESVPAAEPVVHDDVSSARSQAPTASVLQLVQPSAVQGGHSALPL